ncbi:MAG: MBOAT family protein [Deltaproteobacteria bacterium]|nr:MBOAT family protein [Deltaproteobacteria bacterium]
MAFNTLNYAWFFGCVFLVSWLLVRLRLMRLLFLLVASYFFYGNFAWYYLPLILASSSVDYWLGNRIAACEDPKRRKRWLIVTVIVNLGMLGFFKYWDFGLDTVAAAAQSFGWTPSLPYLRLMLPIGISFFTFESMSYVIDVYRGTTKPCDSYWKYLLFVAFFPHLVSGPIVRPRDLIPQFERAPVFDEVEGSRALFLICVGLFKKVVISDYLSVNLVDRVFNNPIDYSALETLAGIYGYAVQIYCDFSGYTDIAIGCAALLGVTFPINFNSPYKAMNLQDFWNRWHISLSSWLRDYLFLPLGGSIGSTARTVRNFIILMLLGGLWHGAAWHFVFWGLLHGVGLAATFVYWMWLQERGIRRRRRKLSPLRRVAGVLVTFHYVCLCWVFFRADSFAKAWAVLKRLTTLTLYHPNLHPWVLAALAVGLITHYTPDDWFERARAEFSSLPGWAQGVLLFCVAVLLREAATSQAVPFVYFQF